MKKAFVGTLSFIFFLHFCVPILFYLGSGFSPFYWVGTKWDDIVHAFFLNAVFYLFTIITILLIPDTDHRTQPRLGSLEFIFYFSVLFSLFSFYSSGGFQGVLEGNQLGTLSGYLGLFLEPTVIVFAILVMQKKPISLYRIMLVFVSYKTFTGSRSAILWVILLVVMSQCSLNVEQYRRRLTRAAIGLVGLSIPLFFLATVLRGSEADLGLLVARVSSLETAAVPLHFLNSPKGIPEMFYQKFDPLRQLFQSIDSVIPGTWFVKDSFPNQYYRSIFLEMSEEFSRKNYMSINMTLPVYLRMYFSPILSTSIGSLLVVLYYLVWSRLARFSTPLLIAGIFSLYDFVYFFDFVMWFSRLAFAFVTVTMLIIGPKLIVQAFFSLKETGNPQTNSETL